MVTLDPLRPLFKTKVRDTLVYHNSGLSVLFAAIMSALSTFDMHS